MALGSGAAVVFGSQFADAGASRGRSFVLYMGLALFSVLVLMALAMTLATAPPLSLVCEPAVLPAPAQPPVAAPWR